MGAVPSIHQIARHPGGEAHGRFALLPSPSASRGFCDRAPETVPQVAAVRVRSRASAPRHVEPVDVEVYDGRMALGRVRSTDDGYRAFDDAGADLGLFNTAKAATEAILAARRNRGGAMRDRAASIARALGGHRSGNGYLCRCPVPSHGKGRGDRNPSLSISDGDQRVLVHCFGGCDPLDVLDELRHRGFLFDNVSRPRLANSAGVPPILPRRVRLIRTVMTDALSAPALLDPTLPKAIHRFIERRLAASKSAPERTYLPTRELRWRSLR